MDEEVIAAAKIILQYLPAKKLYALGDVFFKQGDLACGGQSKQTTFDHDLPEFIHKSVPEFCCHVAACTASFTTLPAYEAHYGSRHKHVCTECKRICPTSHLLDIHITETHDPLFQIQLQKQPMYCCLVEGCSGKFSDSWQRQKHLTKVHKYPHDFRFNCLPRVKNTAKDLMDVQETVAECAAVTDGACTLPITYKPKIPKTICFGMGSSRSFTSTKSRVANQGDKDKKNMKDGSWHRRSDMVDMDTTVDIEEVAFGDMLTALPSPGT